MYLYASYQLSMFLAFVAMDGRKQLNEPVSCTPFHVSATREWLHHSLMTRPSYKAV